MKALKFSILVLIGTFLTSSLFSQILSLQSKKHDFGIIYDTDGKVNYTYMITNSGDKPLILKSVKPSCGCTAAEYTTDSIAPGGEGYIKVSFNPAGYSSAINKSVTVTSNSIEEPINKLLIVATVRKKDTKMIEKYSYPMTTDSRIYPLGIVRLNRKNVNFGKINNVQLFTDTIKVYNVQDTSVTLTFENVPEHVKIEVYPQATLLGQSEGIIILTYDSKLKNDFGPVSDRIYMSFEGLNIDYKNRIIVSANIVEDFSLYTAKQLKNAAHIEFEKLEFDFDTITAGDVVNTVYPFKNSGKSELMIRKIKTSCGCTAGKLDKREYAKKEQGEIVVNFNSRGKRGYVNQRITIITNDPDNPMIELHIKGFVNVPIQ